MMIPKFKNYKTKQGFSNDLSSGSINDELDVCFIENTKELYTHGSFYASIDNFLHGSNSVTSLSNLPIDKKLIIATIDSIENSNLSFSSTPKTGQEFRIILTNTSPFILNLPNNDMFQPISRYAADLSSNSTIIIDLYCVNDSGLCIYNMTLKTESGTLYYQDVLFTDMTENQQVDKKISEIFQVSASDILELQCQVMGAGGNGGNAGDSWGLYDGGSGGAGANGGIYICRFSVLYNDIVTMIRETDGYKLVCNGNTIKAFNGGSGTDGVDATAGGAGNGGSGGTGKENEVTLASNTSTILDSYDPQAPSGTRGGAEDQDISPNPLPEDIQYSHFSRGGKGLATSSEDNIGESGGIILRCYYK